MAQHVLELLHMAAVVLFLLAGLSALMEYRILRERVVLTYAAACVCAAGYALHIVISHNLPKQGTFWIPWTNVVLTVTFGATYFYLVTMRTFVGARGRPLTVALWTQVALASLVLCDLLRYFATANSFLFVPIARMNLSASQREVGEEAYSLLLPAQIVAALFMLSFVFGVMYLLTHMIRRGSREVLVYVGLVANAAIVVNDTLVALSALSGFYLMAFSKAFEIVRIHRDIRTRARERIERRLRQAEKMEAIGRVAGGIAHDFNNILQAVGGNAELAQETLPDGHAAHEDLRAVRDGVAAGRHLVRQLLDVARAQETPAEFLDVAVFLTETTKLLLGIASNKTRLEFVVEPSVGGVRIARGQLTQVLMNLVANARDAMPDGGVIRIQVSTLPGNAATLANARARNEIVISVTDEGIGIPPEVVDHVFEPFFTTKAETGGSGLGLATLYSIVHQAGGHVEVESQVGRGTSFHIHLPGVDA